MWRNRPAGMPGSGMKRWLSTTRTRSKRPWSFSRNIRSSVRCAATPNRHSRTCAPISWKSPSTGTSSITAFPARNWSRSAWFRERAISHDAYSIRRARQDPNRDAQPRVLGFTRQRTGFRRSPPHHKLSFPAQIRRCQILNSARRAGKNALGVAGVILVVYQRSPTPRDAHSR